MIQKIDEKFVPSRGKIKNKNVVNFPLDKTFAIHVFLAQTSPQPS